MGETGKKASEREGDQRRKRGRENKERPKSLLWQARPTWLLLANCCVKPRRNDNTWEVIDYNDEPEPSVFLPTQQRTQKHLHVKYKSPS